jgi:hypothetical protein
VKEPGINAPEEKERALLEVQKYAGLAGTSLRTRISQFYSTRRGADHLTQAARHRNV